MTSQRSAITYPSPKYGPTPEYGDCEMGHGSAARTTCPDCDGHFCLRHAAHEAHAGATGGAEHSDTR